jgi:hypothetical protein
MTTFERLQNETVIPISQVANYLPWRPTKQAIGQWIKSGRLEGIRCGGRVFTSREAVRRFLEKCNATA